MANYIGMVQVSNDTSPALIGSTLYGICSKPASEPAKTVIANDLSLNDTSGKFVNHNYNQLLQGTTIHIKFKNGNSVTSGATLQVGTVTGPPHQIVGNFVCPNDTIVSFTLDENEHWIPNDNAPPEVITNIANNSSSTAVPTTQAVYTFVQDQTGGFAGLTGAMHFRGTVTNTSVVITDGSVILPQIEGYDLENGVPKSEFTPTNGDVVLYEQQEYVWSNSAWELLGDEGSYALKSSTAVVVGITTSTFTPNTLPTLSVTDTTVSSVTVSEGTPASLSTTNVSIPTVTQAGIATTASVSGGILNIILGQNTVLATTPISITGVNEFHPNTPTVVTSTPVTIGSASGWNQGSAASFDLTTTSTIVVVPHSTAP